MPKPEETPAKEDYVVAEVPFKLSELPEDVLTLRQYVGEGTCELG